jgi:hypothetical protein
MDDARMPEEIYAQMESADFGPAMDGESYFTVTLRVPASAAIVAGKWKLVRSGIGKFDWAVSKSEATS